MSKKIEDDKIFIPPAIVDGDKIVFPPIQTEGTDKPKFPVEPLVLEGVKPRSDLPSPPSFSPMKYVPEKHRDRLDVMLRANLIVGAPGSSGLLRELNQPEVVDEIFRSVEELQLELVRESMAQGVGLEAFFPADERRAIKIAKPVRERIEQVILMLGDAFVEHCDNKMRESGELDVDDEFKHGRLMAHKAKETYVDEGHAEGALCELSEAFGLATMDEQLIGMRDGAWDLNATWLHAQSLCASDRFAVHFILSVWSPAPAWDGLDITRAFAMWDARKRGAFTGWTEKPWWP